MRLGDPQLPFHYLLCRMPKHNLQILGITNAGSLTHPSGFMDVKAVQLELEPFPATNLLAKDRIQGEKNIPKIA